MFGALNRIIGRLDGDPQSQRSLQGVGGFQVLRNNNKELALEPWFDFIIGINGRTLVWIVSPTQEMGLIHVRIAVILGCFQQKFETVLGRR
jgi:hypothetical protein